MRTPNCYHIHNFQKKKEKKRGVGGQGGRLYHIKEPRLFQL